MKKKESVKKEKKERGKNWKEKISGKFQVGRIGRRRWEKKEAKIRRDERNESMKREKKGKGRIGSTKI